MALKYDPFKNLPVKTVSSWMTDGPFHLSKQGQDKGIFMTEVLLHIVVDL